jgi:(E)-4-hydroxy-3-methylbut-2-enyl-diphosphate synthase
MTKTDTRDVKSTVSQIRRLERAGVEIVRLAVPDRDAAAALKAIRSQVRVPIVADIHFDHRLALASIEAGADGLRINPGNIGPKRKIAEVVRAARDRGGIPIRIGVNSGSLEKDLLARFGGASAEALAASAVRHIRILEDLDFFEIKVSIKASDIRRTLEACRLLARKTDYPFHAGITESGGLFAGSVKSSAGLALMLREGLVDTLRVSLTAPPEKEVEAGFLLLRGLGLRSPGVELVSCPTCGRCEIDLAGIASAVSRRLASLKGPLRVAVMGCMVNGPGEAKEADIGLACGRAGGVIFRKGRILRKAEGARLLDAFVEAVLEAAAETSSFERPSKAAGRPGPGKK